MCSTTPCWSRSQRKNRSRRHHGEGASSPGGCSISPRARVTAPTSGTRLWAASERCSSISSSSYWSSRSSSSRHMVRFSRAFPRLGSRHAARSSSSRSKHVAALASRSKSADLCAFFIRRFLLHILPTGFVKIRHFGFLANRNRSSALVLCRQLLNAPADGGRPAAALSREPNSLVEHRCPVCHVGVLRIVEWLSAEQALSRRSVGSPTAQIDSS